MILAEPPSSPYDLQFRLGPFPVRVHPMFWLVTLIMGSSLRQPAQLIMWVGVCFVSILIHELGHALAMRYFGESPRVVLYSMGGLAISEGGWARRRMVGGGSGLRSWLEQVIISAAGPVAGFVLAALVLVFVVAAGGRVEFQRPTLRFWAFYSAYLPNPNLLLLVHLLLYVNIGWGLINLLPVFPLDGGQIARSLLTARNPWSGVQTAQWLSVVVAGAIAALAFLVWKDTYLGLMFGWLAAINYLALQGRSIGF